MQKSSHIQTPSNKIQRETETETDRQTDRQASRQTGRQAGRQADNTERDRERQRQTDRQQTHRERENITKSKHVLVWKLLLQIFAHLGAFSRPARSPAANVIFVLGFVLVKRV